MAERGREAKRLGVTLRDEPRAFPGEVVGVFRRSVQTIWRARGGGFYACGFVVTFFWLEAKMFVGDIAAANGVGDYFTGQILEMIFRYFSESFLNGLLALIWPVFLIDFRPPLGIVLLAILYAVFVGLVRKPLEAWLTAADGVARDDASQTAPPEPRERGR